MVFMGIGFIGSIFFAGKRRVPRAQATTSHPEVPKRQRAAELSLNALVFGDAAR
jgi:hypothetical protein